MLQIELPTEFNASHERAVIDYLSNRLSGREAWAQAFAAFDILHQAVLVIEFVQIAAPLEHGFYIVRLSVGARMYTLVVMLQPPAWEQIDGDTVAGDLDTLTHQFPAPVRIQHRGHGLVVLDYDEWKRRILRRQGAAE